MGHILLWILGAAALAVPIAVLVVPSTRWMLVERLPPSWRIALIAWHQGIEVDHAIVIPMPDGVQLHASLFRPKSATGPLPTVLVRLPYGRLRYRGGFDPGLVFTRHGYAVLVQDLRGTGDSGGELLPWRDAAEDGIATLDWIMRQPWSTGKVGTFGCSALGETQFVLAKMNHPAHLAMIPSGAGGAVGSAAARYSYFGVFEGGVFQLASGFGWFVDNGAKDRLSARARPFDHATHLRMLPVSGLVRAVQPSANGYTDFLATPLGDTKWADWGYLADSDRIAVPALVINTWGDQTVGDSLAWSEAWRRSNPTSSARQKVIVAPGDHCGHAGWGASPMNFGEVIVEHGTRPYWDWYLRWFDYWLRGTGDGLSDLSAYNYFMLNENRWLAADSWPPAEARIVRWYLGSGGRANTRNGDGVLVKTVAPSDARDRFRYDPLDPAPSRGGPVCCTGNPHERPGPADQAEVESRDDVLVYTSAPLDEVLRIAGPLRAHFTVSSSATDTDLVARLVHVRPDGKALGIQEGALRLRYRDGFGSATLMEPGRRYDVVVDMRSIAYSIPKGHRLRLDVTSSSFPRLERNLNTGASNNADETRSVVAQNEIHHGANAVSFLELAVLPIEP
jgi:hypothetical protein